MNDAAREKVQKKKARTLSQEIVQLGKRLPEFVVLNDILEQLELNSPDGREIALIIQSLNQSCTD
jgi:peroxiredoxin